MRIATLSNASVGHTRRWVRWFRARGHEVRTWSLEQPIEGFDAERLPAAPLPGAFRYPLAAPALATALARFAPDVVDAHYVPNYGLLGVLAGRRPLSVTAWGSDLLLSGGHDPLRRARVRFVLSRADLVLADADNLANAARKLGADPSRTHAIPWGVDLGRFRPTATREPGLMLSTRMHETVYDLPTLFAGIAPVMMRRPDTRLVVAGDGSDRPRLERIAARLLPAERVRFVGRLSPDALAEWLARADVYLSASRSDSTSVSLLEAMASGAVPVVSDIEGNREWVHDGVEARLFSPGDPRALNVALEGALADPEWRERARGAVRAVVEARADERVNMTRIETLFASLTRRARAS
ncbi:MAG: glycosyltransferase [Candidatus Eisenbacteria bacterium]